MRLAVHRGLDRVARVDDALGQLTVREPQRQPPARLVPVRPHLYQPGERLAVDEPAGRVEKPEPAIALDAAGAELDAPPGGRGRAP